jgi:riboflavin-specific deaminase-like protein
VSLRRLLPDPGPTTVAEQLATFRPWELSGDGRPYVFTNFVATVDGRAALGGGSGSIGTATDTAIFMELRTVADAIMVGAGTLRAERYRRLIRKADRRERREAAGLAADPLAVIVSNRFDLPWDAELFTCGEGRVLVFTASDREAPETATPVAVERHPEGVDLALAMRKLRGEHEIRGLLCEGGPTLHGDLLAANLVDELFVTRAAVIGGGIGPQIAEGMPEARRELELAWLLEKDGELYARYRVAAR